MKWQKGAFAVLSVVALIATFLLAHTFIVAVLEYYNYA